MILEKENKWFKAVEIAKMMNVSVTTVFRLIKAGELKAKRFGGRLRRRIGLFAAVGHSRAIRRSNQTSLRSPAG